ncbi:hypothetical protein WN55_11201 [Dufourea novaeangliae]|uniref:Uncharacterized protein n=1 Tax=Dufourea novaeangliae TaxID=178035 RepID=A0A154NVP0_DUFNO|nr:hypothetical protein WN55_11201 [Dufourea novaeangliae]
MVGVWEARDARVFSISRMEKKREKPRRIEGRGKTEIERDAVTDGAKRWCSRTSRSTRVQARQVDVHEYIPHETGVNDLPQRFPQGGSWGDSGGS